MTKTTFFLTALILAAAFANEAAFAQINTIRHTIDDRFSSGYWLHAVDLDNDGDMDIIAASRKSGLKWSDNDGAGNFVVKEINAGFQDAWSIHAGDIDMDGDIDIVAVSSNEDAQKSEVAWFEQKSGQNFSYHSLDKTFDMLPQSVFVTDLDGDGDGDILVAAWGSDAILWWENTPGDVFKKHTFDAGIGSAHSVSAADINGDGLPEVLASGGGRTAVWVNRGNLDFGRKILGGGGAFGAFLRDLDGDGRLDVVRGERANGNVDWYRNTGGVSYTTQNIVAPGMGEAWSMDIGDFDLDGDMDIVVAGYVFSPNKISFFLNNGEQGFEEQVLEDNFNRPRAVAVADFDQDGDEDIAAVITKANLIVWYEIEGSPVQKMSITVTSPNGGERLGHGSLHTISWQSASAIDSVTIEYSGNSGTSWQIIDQGLANGGSFSWTVPDEPTTRALVRISDVTDPMVSDVSDAVFVIELSSITVLTPNGGEAITGGDVHNIGWTSTGSVPSVNIEYSLDNGQTWRLIQSGMSNVGSSLWSVPDFYSAHALIRISDAADNVPSDVSDAPFTISGRGLTLTSPTGGETWSAGSTQNITWSSVGNISTVNLEYSADNGTSWTTIATAPNTGNYAWSLPPTEINAARLRILDAADRLVAHESGTFSISVNSIALTVPNGGESWPAGSVQVISWQSSGTIPTIKLEYSLDNGSS